MRRPCDDDDCESQQEPSVSIRQSADDAAAVRRPTARARAYSTRNTATQYKLVLAVPGV